MPHVTYLGFPRIGRRRELKRALEAYWKGESAATELIDTAASLRQRHWQLARDAGADSVPVNDFSLYDHVLDAAVALDAIPARYRTLHDADPLAGYFAMARGHQRGGHDLRALEMTKWFDTNYHYIVPELHAGQVFHARPEKPVAEYRQAVAAGHVARPVLLGPVTFLLLSKTVDGSHPLGLLDALLPAWLGLVDALVAEGADWIQVDEPALVLDLEVGARDAFRRVYETLAAHSPASILLATYFGGLESNLGLATSLPVAGLHVDFARAPAQLDAVLDALPDGRVLSAGLVDGRNIWLSDPATLLPRLETLRARVADGRLWIAPSCSLLHVPIDAAEEKQLPGDLAQWLSFARQKIAELRHYADAVAGNASAVQHLARQHEVVAQRLTSPDVVRADVRARVRGLTPQFSQRRSGFAHRAAVQRERFGLPALPTTTIGSFPQTDDLRNARAAFRSGKLDAAAYEERLRDEVRRAVSFQEEAGLDVLVHGEPERNDMVEYFGEQLSGYAFTKYGWVQSYGSRCVKPPIIYGDVARPTPMTVAWSSFAQSLTERPMKGMLTGPVTMLQWSFVRDDLPRADVCRQIALALRDEVHDLERAGIGIVQIDEPALREGLPLRRADWQAYLAWAVDAFRITAGGTSDSTQVHTHMCYSEFNDIIEAVAAMDADVISIETSRSRMELLEAFTRFRYPNGIGPGVYDIHSPRVPAEAEMADLVARALQVLEPDQLWINPDCGLKTRGWKEVGEALRGMVAVARAARERLPA
ncbi:5-methyltetrahydropteroyltriglutamate--homocysteine S-methyltransferase [Luteibacter aegosomatissinici]|uniref:5-methyltetrahydropteroyltriglutamate-- homocysteine S-methyltransferase n=1 Tax=Luteibacter aegosomatissinici TaxID=2911539 RepID=UPI001FF76C30|nr:5-methyltetrahydropteroyltriglutamate--homocysteine S-methyltransferase [Luteibacter aegosomatissinici]UPG95143.1 5-methyltetrahydropteroyltriglutamate--homocysteine S-methyltransferase [Luteibacter aegosomatissinici]